jgi:hypothetical protein
MKRRMLGALALLATTALPASATTEASLSLSDFSATLKDLNTADGIAPSIAWTFDTMQTSSTDAVQQSWLTLSGFSLPVWSSGTGIYAHSDTAGVMDGVSLYGNGNLHIASSGAGLDALTLSAHAESGQSVNTGAALYEYFTLSAGTQVTFSMTVNANWSSNATIGQLPSPDWAGELTSSGLYANMTASSLFVNTQASGYSNWPYLPDTYDSEIDGQVVKLVLKNTSNTDKVYQFTLTSGVYAEETALPVPEPASYAMLIAGLLVLGGARRRRRS